MINNLKDFDNKVETSVSSSSKDIFGKILITTLTTVFLAELGDKTQIATLLISAQTGRPISVFIGAALALICSSLVGVILGQWLSKTLSPKNFEYMAGALMIGIGLWIGIQATYSIFINEVLK